MYDMNTIPVCIIRVCLEGMLGVRGSIMALLVCGTPPWTSGAHI